MADTTTGNDGASTSKHAEITSEIEPVVEPPPDPPTEWETDADAERENQEEMFLEQLKKDLEEEANIVIEAPTPIFGLQDSLMWAPLPVEVVDPPPIPQKKNLLSFWSCCFGGNITETAEAKKV